MSVVVDLLKKQASDLRKVVEKPSTQEEWEQVKSAALNALVLSGMDQGEASSILTGLEKEAGIGGAPVAPSIDVLHIAEVLEKSAAYIEQIETQLSDSSVKIEGMQAELDKVASERDSGLISSLKDRGFSDNEIATLRTLPRESIEKIAHTSEAAWDLGEAAGAAAGSLDSITEFLMR